MFEDNYELDPDEFEQEALQKAADPERAGHRVDDQKVFFPVMTSDELANITLPADALKDQIQAMLRMHGTCLLTGVLDAAECQYFERLWQEDLLSIINDTAAGLQPEHAAVLQKLQKEGLKAWPHCWSDGLGQKEKGSASLRGAPHGSFAWQARLHPAVRDIFARIFDVPASETVVGLDCTFWSSADTLAAESNNEWLHCDQNYKTGLKERCFQGVLYVWPSEDDCSSTTVIWPGSHRIYQRLMSDPLAESKRQSLHLNKLQNLCLRESLLDIAIAGSRRVPCPAGSLLLWDSRAIHQGWAGGPRLAQPVCWEPRSRRAGVEGAIRRKIYMAAAGVPSTHSSSEGRVHGLALRGPLWELTPSSFLPPFRSQLVPYSVDQSKIADWHDAQTQIWGNDGNPRKNADRVDDSKLADLLKPEVLAVL